MICAPALNHKLKKFCIYRGVSEIVFLKNLHKRTEEIRIGQWKGYYMEHWGSGTPQPANKFKMAERWMKLQEPEWLLVVTRHCSVLVFPLQKLLCWNFHNFLLRNIALVLLKNHKLCQSSMSVSRLHDLNHLLPVLNEGIKFACLIKYPWQVNLSSSS